ncbi:MAG: hypothetical protein LC632_05625 [Xanthomonadaceae bacterium]|nr:hypothetical protein [Xanthomonadaceae bacterium]
MSDNRRELESWTDNQVAAVEVGTAARRALRLLSYDLEPQIYGEQDFIDVVRSVATSGRFASVRVLVQDSARAVRDGHRLVELARRLPTFIELRKPHSDHRSLIEAYLVADERALLYRKQADRYEGFVDVDDPLQARRLVREFDQVWGRATPDPELRRLGL